MTPPAAARVLAAEPTERGRSPTSAACSTTAPARRPSRRPSARRRTRSSSSSVTSACSGRAPCKDGSFDWSALVDRAGAAPAATRFDAQYWRANASPWERYVLTPAGSVKHRLPSHDSGFANLKLAGDWTGQRHRRRLRRGGGDLRDGRGPGDHRRRRARSPAGAPTGCARSRASCRPTSSSAGAPPRPSPFACEGGRLRGLLLEGDGSRIADAGRARCSTCPAGRGVEYRAARVARDAAGRQLRARHLADPALRPLGRGARDAGVVLDPRARRPRPRRRLRRRAPAAGRAVRARRQPDVLPGRARDVRVRQDDGPLRPGCGRGRPRDDPGVRRQLRPQRGRRLARLPRGQRRRAAGEPPRRSGRDLGAARARAPPGRRRARAGGGRRGDRSATSSSPAG